VTVVFDLTLLWRNSVHAAPAKMDGAMAVVAALVCGIDV
jgi:hypothetical protein